MIRFVLCLLVLVPLLAAACVSTRQAYSGPRRDAGEVARLRGDLHVRILAVDEIELYDRDVEILPGERQVQFVYRLAATELYDNLIGRAHYRCWISFEAKPGRAYRLDRSEPRQINRVKRGVGSWYERWEHYAALVDEADGEIGKAACAYDPEYEGLPVR